VVSDVYGPHGSIDEARRVLWGVFVEKAAAEAENEEKFENFRRHQETAVERREEFERFWEGQQDDKNF
jgi:hypothetical protein